MKTLYEIGIVFRGFILVNHIFKKLPTQLERHKKEADKDLRGAFISAISTFAQSFFKSSSLEYLESDNVLFIFKMSEVKSSDSQMKEPIIMYGLSEKKKKNSDKIVKKILEKIEPILELFIQKFNGVDFSEIDQFKKFKNELIEFFEK
ncbi:MAG: hypothetical protein ACTSUT_09420 [Promethearchaeota archaeon]